jgi:hypothetical protein
VIKVSISRSLFIESYLLPFSRVNKIEATTNEILSRIFV